VIEQLRAHAETNIPAIIVTADHTQDVRDKIRDSGHPVLHKPIKPAALRALMSRILTRH
jgi:DNA-binding response OmpR family regulator